MTGLALLHRTLETGHEQLSPRSEVSADVLAHLRPLLREALHHGRRVHVGADWWVQVLEDADRLEFALAVDAWTEPLYRCQVTPPAGVGRPSLLEVSSSGLLDQVASRGDKAAEAAELERCLAWAWLTL